MIFSTDDSSPHDLEALSYSIIGTCEIESSVCEEIPNLKASTMKRRSGNCSLPEYQTW